MTRVSTPPILLDLHNAESLSSQVAALRALKNETIGHDQRKEAWIRGGIIPILSRILASRRPSGKRILEQELNGTAEPRELSGTRSEEEDACLQVIIIVGSLAQGILLRGFESACKVRSPATDIDNQVARLFFTPFFLATSSPRSYQYSLLPIAPLFYAIPSSER